MNNIVSTFARWSTKSMRGARKKKFDPFYYMGYIDDNESIAAIEAKFQIMESRMAASKDGQTEEEIAKSVFLDTVTPTQVPIDVWFDLENYGEEEDIIQEDDFDPDNFFDEDDEMPHSRGMGRSRSRGNMEGGSGPNFANFTQTDNLGSGIELWPDYKLRPIDQDLSQPMEQTEFPNCQTGISEKQFIQLAKECPLYTVENMTAQTILSVVNKHTKGHKNSIDAFIIDVPFGFNGWDKEKFYSFLSDLKNTYEMTFFVIWADPKDLPTVVNTCEKLELRFCDSISCELLDPLGTPVSIDIGHGNMHRETRMLVMYRTDDINRNDLAQQRIKDTGWGVSVMGGKTYNRHSMPTVAHKIIETMLPPRKGSPRTFCELWPSTFIRRSGWIMINEKENYSPEGTPYAGKVKKYRR